MQGYSWRRGSTGLKCIVRAGSINCALRRRSWRQDSPRCSVSSPVQLALLLLAALCPALAFALSGTYEGKLIPINNDSPITIVVQLEEIGGFLIGKVKTSSPLSYNSTIDSGRNVAGYCNLASVLSSPGDLAPLRKLQHYRVRGQLHALLHAVEILGEGHVPSHDARSPNRARGAALWAVTLRRASSSRA